ncbi:MAG: DMT family transporter [Desulfatiglandaceae bacterium]
MSEANTERLHGTLVMLLTATLWSTSGLGIKLVSWNPVAITGARSLIAAVLLITFARRFSVPKTPAGVMASISYALCMLTFVIANKLTTSANAIFLQYLSPAFVAVLGIAMLKEMPSRFDWAVLLGVLGGMTLFFIDRIGPGAMMGNVSAVASGLCLAFFIIFMRIDSGQTGGRHTALDNMIFSHLLAAAMSLPAVLTSSMPDFPSMAGILYMGVFQMGLASILFPYGVRRLTAVGTSIITLIEPVLNPVWVFLIIGEIPSLNAVIGGMIIIVLVAVRSVVSIRRASVRA